MAFFFFGNGGDKVSKPYYSIEHLQTLYNRLQNINKDADGEQMVQVIQQITEALIWGEQNGHDHNFFDFFCEKNILADFVRVLGLPRVPKTVKVQLLQTLSMLIQNIRRDTSLYYLFSNNYVNQLISTSFDWSDEEILGYYISFLKSLALRLNAETIKFFFNHITQQFPLYIEAIRFFGHRDQMVRTATRTLTLKVYTVQDPAMQRFVVERSWDTYFVHLACHLRELWLRLDEACRRAEAGGDASSGSLQEAIEQQQDLLMYISDVLGLENHALSEALTERVLRYALFPVLLGSLLEASPCSSASPSSASLASPGAGDGAEAAGLQASSSGAAASEAMAGKYRLSLNCALFALHQVFDAFRSARSLLEPFTAALAVRRPPPELLNCCLEAPPPPPPTYRSTTSDVSGPSSSEAARAGGPSQGLGEPGIAALVLEACMAEDGENEAVSDIEKEKTAAGEQERKNEEHGQEEKEENITRLGAKENAEADSRSLRGCLLDHLQSRSDACVLLVVGVLSACLACSSVLPQALLRNAGLVPRHLVRGKVEGSSEGGSSMPRGCSNGEAEVLLRVTQALERALALRVVVLQALMRLALDIAANPAVSGCSRCCAAPMAAAHRALRTAARHVSAAMHGDLGDVFLDVFAEEWESHHSGIPVLAVREVCSGTRCLLPAALGYSAPGCPVEWAFPASHSERQHAAKAVRCLLLIQRLCAEFPSPEGDRCGSLLVPSNGDGSAAQVGVADAVAVESPLYVAEEVADGYKEAGAFDLGRQDRIVCAVATQEGRHTRYLVLHPSLLLLVQPDLVSPGRAIVRTLAPVRAVEAQVDRNDPRTLRLCVRLPKGAPPPSEASPLDPSATNAEKVFWLSAEDHRGSGSAFFVLTLNFEDTKRCTCADVHLRKRRQEVRAKVQARVEAFVDELTT